MTRVCDDIPFVRAEVDQPHPGMAESRDALKGRVAPSWPTPQRSTLSMHGRKEVAMAAPLHKRLGPKLAREDLIRLGLLVVVPCHLSHILVTHRELITRTIVRKPRMQRFHRIESLFCWRRVFVRHTHEVRKGSHGHHPERVCLVQLIAVRLLDGQLRLDGRGELDKSKAFRQSRALVFWHEQLTDGADLAEDLAEHVSKLVKFSFGNSRHVVHHDHAVRALLLYDISFIIRAVVARVAVLLAGLELQEIHVERAILKLQLTKDLPRIAPCCAHTAHLFRRRHALLLLSDSVTGGQCRRHAYVCPH
mmetsp:Transcript_18543/g.57597  ORF Transcript_18543/g.57597 Transcript_18543/m.57597 type:complete len:306 (-) Transcript_18543:145-1062(-)